VNCHEAIDLMGDSIEGTLAPAERAGLDDHFAECSPCRNYMDQLRITCEALGRLPGRLVIYAVEAATLETGNALSPEVAAAADELVRNVEDEIASFVNTWQTSSRETST